MYKYMKSCYLPINVVNLKYFHIAKNLLSSSATEKVQKPQKKSTKYKNTILFSSSLFPTSIRGKKRIDNENKIREIADFESKYIAQDKAQDSGSYYLHDGPPYANGKLHMGHALNKILKDITIRYKYLKGHKVNFVPGWDCHGLPIELKALEKAQKKGETIGIWDNLNPIEIRSKARALAEENIEIQKKTFKQWGLFTNWKNYYCTNKPKYIGKQLKLFKKLYDQGYIFQAYMPVHFSPSSRTSLAESELEYNENHESPSLYLALPLAKDRNEEIFGNLARSYPIYLSIWTTTPWTLPANMAVCIDEEKDYSLVLTQIGGKDVILVWNSDTIPMLVALLKSPCKIITQVKGKQLTMLKYVHPLNKDVMCPVLSASHVSSTKGTGLVHTAPAHGKDDFLIALKDGLKTDIQLIDDTGHYKREAGEHLFGKPVLEEGNDAVLRLIKNSSTQDTSSPLIIDLSTIIHSYPYDWRTKKPTIIRASKQWFFDIEKVKDATKKALDNVSIHPEKLRKNFVTLLENRPYWCLSRQRVWGVPIPVFYDSKSGEPLVESHFIEHIIDLMEKEGPDIWWKYSEKELLPPSFVNTLEEKGEPLPKKGSDIFDIWFDSGSSWFCVMNGKKSDVYMEGHDQANGWFQSSLLTSVACTGEAPFKSLVLHGFTVDEHYRKMSKSLNNVFDPLEITNGGKNLKSSPPFGVNVLRWWTTTSTLINDVPFGLGVVQSCENDVQAMRNTFSYFLGILNSFNSNKIMNLENLRLQDQYVLSQIQLYLNKVWNFYEDYEYDKVAEIVYNFIVNEVGNDYVNSTKDILYFEEVNDPRRLSVQTTLYLILPYLLRSLEPILPHLTEEVSLFYNNINNSDPISIRGEGIEPPPEWNLFKNLSAFEHVLRVKEAFDHEIAAIMAKEEKVVDTIKYNVNIKAGKHLQSSLKLFQSHNTENNSDLCSFLRVSQVITDFSSYPSEGFSLEVTEAAGNICERCRKYSTCEKAICERCEKVIEKL